MKAPSSGYRIVHRNSAPFDAQRPSVDRPWEVRDDRADGRVVWSGKTFTAARNAHYRLAVARITGRPVSAAQARRAGNA